MPNVYRTSIILAAGCALAMVGIALGDAPQAVVVKPDQVKFNPGPAGVTTGLSLAVLAGPLDQPVLYTLRVHLAAGGFIVPHTHPDTRYVTVLSGELNAGRGETIDASNETALETGTFFVVPAGMPHYAVARHGEVVYQETGIGPTGNNFLKK